MKYFYPKGHEKYPLYSFIEKYEINGDDVVIFYSNGEVRTQKYSIDLLYALERIMEYQVIDAASIKEGITKEQIEEIKKYKFYLQNKERLNKNNIYINDMRHYTIEDLIDFKIIKLKK